MYYVYCVRLETYLSGDIGIGSNATPMDPEKRYARTFKTFQEAEIMASLLPKEYGAKAWPPYKPEPNLFKSKKPDDE